VEKSSNAGLIAISFQLNGKPVSLEVAGPETALSAIRDRLGLTGAKEGCGIGECGACTIIVDGLAVNSCLTLAAQLHGREVVTVEGLGETEKLHPLQEKFLTHGAVQCGFCTPGMLMSAKSLLDRNPDPGKQEIVEALAGNLCRCTGYVQILEAVEDAAKDVGTALSAKTSCKCADG
jgi:carbon-monoxide dehydrogenase small subunit